MSTQPPKPDGGDDGFPNPGEGTETIKYMVGSRFAGGPVTSRSVPGHVMGELVTRVSKLYSALKDGGSNLSRAVDTHPFAYVGTDFKASVDVYLEPPAGDDEGRLPIESDERGGEALNALRQLTSADSDQIAEVAAGYGGAVAMAYRQLVAVLGQRNISTSFFKAVDGEPVPDSFVRLGTLRAGAHALALSDQSVLRIQSRRLVGILDELAGGRSVFKLQRPVDLGPEQDEGWREAVGRARSVEGQLTDEAATDIRRLNAWSSLVEVELELTYMNAPTSTRTEEIDAEMLRIISVQQQLDAE